MATKNSGPGQTSKILVNEIPHPQHLVLLQLGFFMRFILGGRLSKYSRQIDRRTSTRLNLNFPCFVFSDEVTGTAKFF